MSEKPPPGVEVFVRCRDKYGVYVPTARAIWRADRWLMVSRTKTYPLEEGHVVLAWAMQRSDL